MNDNINIIGCNNSDLIIGELKFQKIKNTNLIFFDFTPLEVNEPLILKSIYLSGAGDGIEFYIGNELILKHYDKTSVIDICCQVPLYLISKPFRIVLPFNSAITNAIATYNSTSRILDHKSIQKFTILDKTITVLNGEIYHIGIEDVIRFVEKISLDTN